ncbi:interferon alpha-inducible protein 27-like protein 1 [Cottoperca gobio]|uniref:Interferon alpha-inducible protein 27-like protein 1 n=1 Tax=Cottoperca gobio TaxID=56716 RepID=A0A6J2S420_COTGO|nr:interferon alpha-inducible protein 27-like protein 1 [Cottoperca gobio]
MMEQLCEAFFNATGTVRGLFLVPIILNFLGFTAVGIVAGSIAAKLMSFFAILYGGGVPAGGLVAILQSLGMAGFTAIAKAFAGGVGGAAAWLLSEICKTTGTQTFIKV